jgi:PAS domain S-box-containing protein
MFKNIDGGKDGKLRRGKKIPTKGEYYELLLEVIRLRQIVENMPGNLYWKNLNGVYLGCNDNLKNILGDISGKTLYQLVDNEEAEKIEQLDNVVIESDKEQFIEETTIVDGVKRTFLTRKRPMYDFNSQIVGLIGLSIDVTDSRQLKMLEEEQTISRKQIGAMKTIASSMSHDLRNILAGINLGLGRLNNFFNRWLKRDLPKNDIEDLKDQEGLIGKLIKRIKDAVTFLEIQLKNITTEKIDTSKFTMLRASECVQKALDDFSWQNDDMRNRVSVTVNKDWVFMGDLTLTKHLLFNLFSNSTYYIQEQGKGTISIVLTEEDFQPILYFRDTAKGITKDDASKIFDRFFTERTDGTGMGLAFCKSVVLAYAGEITCTGKEGEFIEFKIKLPRAIEGWYKSSKNLEKCHNDW